MAKGTHRSFFLALSLGDGVSAAGCTKGGPTVDRTQPKPRRQGSVFEGEWWVAQTVIEADADATRAHLDWRHGVGSDLGCGPRKESQGLSGRIRWVIDEELLVRVPIVRARRGFEHRWSRYHSTGVSRSPRFEIIDHVDVRPRIQSGERVKPRNIIEENNRRPPLVRARVHACGLVEEPRSFVLFCRRAMPALGDWTLEPGEFFIQDGAAHCTGEGEEEQRCSFPRSWEPQFVMVGEDPGYRFAYEWPEGSDDITHYMSFVTFMNLSPGDVCVQTSGTPCQTLAIPHRLAFLRVPPDHQYAAATQTHEEFDRFGVFRTNQRTYVRADQDSVTRRCDRDIDCGIGGYCDVQRRVCAGGLGEDYGETDALAFLRPRHNLFQQSLTDQVCSVDWECDGRFADTPGIGGSVCDRAARRCTIPIRDRVARQLTDGPGAIAYHLTEGFPVHLVSPAMEVMGNWNEVFMRGWRAARDHALPTYAEVRVSCQTVDPTRYCFCGSPDDVGGTCRGKYDPFVSPETGRGSE